MEFNTDTYVVTEPNFPGAPIAKSCSLNCIVTTDKSKLSTADAVLFENIPVNINNNWDWLRNPIMLPQKRPGQLWVNFGYQNSKVYPLLDQKIFLDQFDVNMTYEQTTGPNKVPISLHCGWGVENYEEVLLE